MSDIIKRPEEVLFEISENVTKEELQTEEFKKNIQDMIDVGIRYNAAGVAAPQIGWSKRVFIYYDEEWKVVVNPVVKMKSERVSNIERCLSCDNVYKVKRYKRIRVDALNLEGERIVIDSKNKKISFCLQHEIDHLNGILIADIGKLEE